jgi:gamma-glutamyltranspeptidase
MTPEEAVSAPRFSTNYLQDSFTPDSQRLAAIPSDVFLLVNPGIDSITLSALKQKGHVIKESEKEIGAPVLILIDNETGVSHAASDPKIAHFTGIVP